MRRKSIQLLLLISVLVQAFALVIAIGMTAAQTIVKGVIATYSEMIDIFSVPVQSLLRIILLLAVYVVGFLIVRNASVKNARIEACVLVGIAVLIQIMLQYANLFINPIISMEGAAALASYATLENTVSMIANPLTCVAFALFCFACGGCFGTPSETE